MQEGMYLSGISPEVTILPPVPYPTLPPMPGPTPPQSCSPPVSLVYNPNHVRLGTTTDGFMAFDLPADVRANFENRYGFEFGHCRNIIDVLLCALYLY